MTSDYFEGGGGRGGLRLGTEISQITPLATLNHYPIFLWSNIFNSSITTVIISAIVLGHVVSLSPDYAQAKQATNRVLYLLDHVPPIDSYSNEGKQPVSESVIF